MPKEEAGDCGHERGVLPPWCARVRWKGKGKEEEHGEDGGDGVAMATLRRGGVGVNVMTVDVAVNPHCNNNKRGGDDSSVSSPTSSTSLLASAPRAVEMR